MLTLTTEIAPAARPDYRQGAMPTVTGVQVWLLTVAAFVCAMVIVGGATRLTGSGLSITEWQPVLGVIPPSSEAGWQAAFEKYQAIPEYRLVNKGMALEAFKTLYWWEWGHRFLGRLTGFVFLVPFVMFLYRRSIPQGFTLKISALFLLGGAQGALGWFMVKSGLSGRVDVSQYRLAAHLALAVAIAAYAFWLALSLGQARSGSMRQQTSVKAPSRSAFQISAGVLAGVVYLQIVMGGFVAGLKAGYVSNTWPSMNGSLVPDGLNVFSPWYVNVFENPLTAQFVHRMLGYTVAAFAFGLAFVVMRSGRGPRVRTLVPALCGAILVQIALGVATVVSGVSIGFALAHQANALAVLALTLWILHRSTVRR